MFPTNSVLYSLSSPNNAKEYSSCDNHLLNAVGRGLRRAVAEDSEGTHVQDTIVLCTELGGMASKGVKNKAIRLSSRIVFHYGKATQKIARIFE